MKPNYPKEPFPAAARHITSATSQYLATSHINTTAALQEAAIGGLTSGALHGVGSFTQSLRRAPRPPSLSRRKRWPQKPNCLRLRRGTRPVAEIGPAGNPGAAPGRAVADHHLMPQQFREFFEGRGVNIDDYTVSLDRTTHLRGVHGSGLPASGMPGGWNARWAEWIEANPNASALDVYRQTGALMDEYGLSGRSIHPYGKP